MSRWQPVSPSFLCAPSRVDELMSPGKVQKSHLSSRRSATPGKKEKKRPADRRRPALRRRRVILGLWPCASSRCSGYRPSMLGHRRATLTAPWSLGSTCSCTVAAALPVAARRTHSQHWGTCAPHAPGTLRNFFRPVFELLRLCRAPHLRHVTTFCFCLPDAVMPRLPLAQRPVGPPR